jgi:hypothetical protein
LWREVPVTATHLLDGVADDVIDDSLVDPGRSKARDEGMSKDVQPANDRPFIATPQQSLEMIVTVPNG